jgi:signal transduction histidine kinase
VEYEYTARFPIGEASRRSFLVPLPGDSGRIEHVLLAAVDLTAMRRVEAQLRQAQKMEAIGQLTGGIAHDFNNLLTVISGNLETLQRRLGDNADDRLQRSISSALQGASRAALLTHQLLAFSRRQTLEPKSVSVNTLIARTSELLHRTLSEAISIETVLAGGVWNTFVDANQLENCLLNLAVNARDAMPKGGWLSVSTRVEDGQVMAEIGDTGPGIPSEHLSRIYDPFFTTKSIGKGTGLGLSITYGIVREHDGTLSCQSAVGHGTKFTVALPQSTAKVGRSSSAAKN